MLSRVIVLSFLSVSYESSNEIYDNSDWTSAWNLRFPGCPPGISSVNIAVSKPADASRLFIDSNAMIHRTHPSNGLEMWTDEEKRLLLAVDINTRTWPQNAIVRMFVSAQSRRKEADLEQMESNPVNGVIEKVSDSLPFTDFDEGEYTISAILYFPNGNKVSSCSNATFLAARHLEHAFPPSITFSAEEPWDQSQFPSSMDDVGSWETVAEDFDKSEGDNTELGFLARRWRDLAGGYGQDNESFFVGSTAQATLREYTAEHARAVQDADGVSRAMFLIFRPFPGSGLGNHLLALVRPAPLLAAPEPSGGPAGAVKPACRR